MNKLWQWLTDPPDMRRIEIIAILILSFFFYHLIF